MAVEMEHAPIPASVRGLNNCRFPESRGGGTQATEQVPTVALAASRAAFKIPTPLEVATSFDAELHQRIAAMDSEGGHGERSAIDIATTVDPVVLASVGNMDWGA